MAIDEHRGGCRKDPLRDLHSRRWNDELWPFATSVIEIGNTTQRGKWSVMVSWASMTTPRWSIAPLSINKSFEITFGRFKFSRYVIAHRLRICLWIAHQRRILWVLVIFALVSFLVPRWYCLWQQCVLLTALLGGGNAVCNAWQRESPTLTWGLPMLRVIRDRFELKISRLKIKVTQCSLCSYKCAINNERVDCFLRNMRKGCCQDMRG